MDAQVTSSSQTQTSPLISSCVEFVAKFFCALKVVCVAFQVRFRLHGSG
jgi:hypothetical protein